MDFASIKAGYIAAVPFNAHLGLLVESVGSGVGVVSVRVAANWRAR